MEILPRGENTKWNRFIHSAKEEGRETEERQEINKTLRGEGRGEMEITHSPSPVRHLNHEIFEKNYSLGTNVRRTTPSKGSSWFHTMAAGCRLQLQRTKGKIMEKKKMEIGIQRYYRKSG